MNRYFEAYREGREDAAGYLSNISLGGLLLTGKFPIQTNIVMPLRITLDMAVIPDGELRVKTRVLRCGKEADSEMYSAGCRLIDLSENSRNIIERMIELYRAD